MNGQKDYKNSNLKNWQVKLHTVIFEADTKAGRFFDVVLLWAILFSVILVMAESVSELRDRYEDLFWTLEWIFTILFTIEYVLRILCVVRPVRYMISFYGLIDLLSIVPTYLSLFFIDTHSLRIIRALRLLRVFRVLKLARFVKESDLIIQALKNSRYRIIVFLFGVLAVTSIMGTIMYIVESPETGFTSIPRSIYWAIVTLTTVGFGDIAPQTDLGQFIASIVMVLGYAIIAIPTGIITGEVIKSADNSKVNTQVCINCQFDQHDSDAKYCKKCGHSL